MIRAHKNNSGQLAVGLALGFCCILAMFGLVFQSSLYTIDKAKLQTTSDYAVLIASNNQSDNLNKIREINRIINDGWLIAQQALQPSFCSMNLLVNTYEPMGITTGAATALTNKSYADCDSACDAYDQYWRDKIIKAYTVTRNQAAEAVMSIITEADELSYQDALNIFLAPENLPNGMYMELQHKLGKEFKTSAVRAEYEKGNLSNDEEFGYDILSQNREDWLFNPKNEQRTFSYMNYGYSDSQCGVTPYSYSCCIGGWPGPPKFTPSNVRVVRQSKDSSYFLAGIRYTPPLTIIQKMLKIGIRNPDQNDPKFGEQSSTGSTKDTLFRKIDKNKRTMFQVLSAAKPYGGEYPEGGFIADITGMSGTSGESFKGSKLFGIADYNEELEGVRINRADGTVENKDYQGNTSQEMPYIAEDFLH